jgi:hypothetical protein
LNYHPFKTIRSIWVVVIGLELLSLACPGIGFGSYYVIIYAYVTLSLLWLFFILLVWRLGFGVMEMELVGVMPVGQGFCSVRCWKPVVSYHTQI